MAKILRTSGQEEALEQISRTLRVVRNVNGFLEELPLQKDLTVSVVFTAGKEKVAVPCDKKEAAKFLVEYACRREKEVRNIARKYVIGLDREDEKILAMQSEARRMRKAAKEERNEEEETEQESQDDSSQYIDVACAFLP